MKRIIVSITLVLLALPTYAQDLGEFTFDGFVRTGFLWTKEEKYGQDVVTKVRMQNLDDAGSGQGRVRMNFSYAINNVGIKGRLQWDDWQNSQKAPEWPYLFGYINSFQDQLTISMGKLGASPWGTGGPEMYRELEVMTSGGGGARVEYKPVFVPGLNVGFVLNWYDGSLDRHAGSEVEITDILMETVFGAAYEHELFLVHFEYRLDSDIDQRPGSFASGNEGTDMIYRLEERVIKNYLPGFQVWAMGALEGLGSDYEECKRYVNWLFAQYAQDLFTAQIRFGYNFVDKRDILHIKPSFYFHFFDHFLTVGASFYFANDSGENKINKNAPYMQIELEPKIQLDFKNAYIAFVYQFTQEYKKPQPEKDLPLDRTQKMNLRFGMSF